MEEEKWQKEKVHGRALITSPRYTTILSRKHQSQSNPWYHAERATDSALGHRYSCSSFECHEILTGDKAPIDKDSETIHELQAITGNVPDQKPLKK